MIIEATGGTVRARPVTADHPNLRLAGLPQTVLGLLTGMLSLEDAYVGGLETEGDLKMLDRLLPHQSTRTAGDHGGVGN